ncbi:MAG: hypothetical protein H0V25_09120, partial [Solirubrobacterales bacterium]|nr:hypothetical protein [Solirubrobacterales bacterium]
SALPLSARSTATAPAAPSAGRPVADFISAFNSETDDHPSMFWMFFLAVPFFLAGGAGLNAGFLGASARYAAGEVGPTLQATFDSSEADHRGVTCEHCGAQRGGISVLRQLR